MSQLGQEGWSGQKCLKSEGDSIEQPLPESDREEQMIGALSTEESKIFKKLRFNQKIQILDEKNKKPQKLFCYSILKKRQQF
ncbi:unnamed protein product [Paramecium octaurelia]|uniref:Uncharacterized protein n=1 Tax=Paramecium octaurelia TaxID=43137 RepID=A0A8S1TYL1_PAROT|nr:unnamed protein product [Paramecium octaurelia]